MLSFIDSTMPVKKNHGVVSMVRYPSSNHVFLVIESTKDNHKIDIQKAHLIIKHGSDNNCIDRHVNRQNTGLSFFNQSSIDQSRQVLGMSPLPSQKAEIELETIEDATDIFDRTLGQGRILAKSYAITDETIMKLINDIQKDISEDKIHYNYSGDGSIYSSNYSSADYHSCVSWCIKKLSNIDIFIDKNFSDFVVINPKNKLSDPQNQSRCVIS